MSTAQRVRGRSVSASDLEHLGKTAARLSDTSGLSLTEAAIRTLEPEMLNAEQIRRAVEHCNINAVNAKFASMRGDRIVHIDGGPADPLSVIDALHASASAPGAHLMDLSYSAPPSYEKRAHALPSAPAPNLGELRRKLAGAHDELVDMCSGLEFRMEMKFAELEQAALRAHWGGASLCDLTSSWASLDPQVAKVAAKQLLSQIPWGEKRAGLRIDEEHSVMRAFEEFSKVAAEFNRAVEARRNVESELSRVAGFLSQHVS